MRTIAVDLAAGVGVRCRPVWRLLQRGHSAGEARCPGLSRCMFGPASCDSLAKSTRPTYEAQITQFDADACWQRCALCGDSWLQERSQGTGVGDAAAAAALPIPTPIADPPGQQLVADAAKRVAQRARDLRRAALPHRCLRPRAGRHGQLSAVRPLGAEKLLRLDLRMQVGDKPATVQEIRGEESYWVRRDVPPLPPSLGASICGSFANRSLARALPAGRRSPAARRMDHARRPVARLASSTNFAFATPQADELQFNAADGKSVVRLPIWIVHRPMEARAAGPLCRARAGKPPHSRATSRPASSWSLAAPKTCCRYFPIASPIGARQPRKRRQGHRRAGDRASY